MPLPATCLAFGLPPALLTQVQLALVPSTSVHDVRSLAALARGLQATPEACLLLGVPADNNLGVIDELQRLRVWHPASAALALFLPTSSPVGALHFGRVGITDIVDLNETVDGPTLQGALRRCIEAHIAAVVWAEMRPSIPASLAPLLRTALELASHPTSAAALAAATCLPERTLRQRCVQAGLPSPRWIVGWARVLLAEYYLRQAGYSMRDVTLLLRFPSVGAMRQQLRRFSSWPWAPRPQDDPRDVKRAANAVRARPTRQARRMVRLELGSSGCAPA